MQPQLVSQIASYLDPHSLLSSCKDELSGNGSSGSSSSGSAGGGQQQVIAIENKSPLSSLPSMHVRVPFILIQSDVKEVAEEMRRSFRDEPRLQDLTEDFEDWIAHNPLGVPTERENLTLSQGLPVYRTVFLKKD